MRIIKLEYDHGHNGQWIVPGGTWVILIRRDIRRDGGYVRVIDHRGVTRTLWLSQRELGSGMVLPPSEG